MFESKLKVLGTFNAFPRFKAEMLYMVPFTRESIPECAQRWTGVIKDMLYNVNHDGTMFLMVDQAELKAGQIHRRPGVHVDGYWSGDNHRGHVPRAGAVDVGNPWTRVDLTSPEAILLASDVEGSRFFTGRYENRIRNGGDASQVSLDGCEVHTGKPKWIYAGNAAMLHESTPVAQDCRRTVVRINIPGWTP